MFDEPGHFDEMRPAASERCSDGDLIVGIKLREPEAMRILSRRYAGIVMAVVFRIVRQRDVAGKILEDVFFELWKYPVDNNGLLLDHLLSHARTRAIQWRSSQALPLVSYAAEIPQLEYDVEKWFETPNLRWQRERAQTALRRIPDTVLRVMEMACLDLWDLEEIACRMELDIAAVQSLIREGILTFRDALHSMPAAARPLDPLHFPLVNLDHVRVLVVDDEVDARRVVSYALQAAGAVVTSAASVAEALAILPKVNPEVLLSDLAMPDEDGFDLIRAVRRSGRTARDLPAVALSAFETKQVRRDAMFAGFQMHVAKPVDPHQLAEVVATFAGRTGI